MASPDVSDTINSLFEIAEMACAAAVEDILADPSFFDGVTDAPRAFGFINAVRTERDHATIGGPISALATLIAIREANMARFPQTVAAFAPYNHAHHHLLIERFVARYREHAARLARSELQELGFDADALETEAAKFESSVDFSTMSVEDYSGAYESLMRRCLELMSSVVAEVTTIRHHFLIRATRFSDPTTYLLALVAANLMPSLQVDLSQFMFGMAKDAFGFINRPEFRFWIDNIDSTENTINKDGAPHFKALFDKPDVAVVDAFLEALCIVAPKWARLDFDSLSDAQRADLDPTKTAIDSFTEEGFKAIFAKMDTAERRTVFSNFITVFVTMASRRSNELDGATKT